VALGSAAAWRHFNLLSEYDFSEEKLRDGMGIRLPKLRTKRGAILGALRRPKTQSMKGITPNPMSHLVPLLEFNQITFRGFSQKHPCTKKLIVLKTTLTPERYAASDSAGSKSSIKCGWIEHRTTENYTTLIKSNTDPGSSNSKQLTANNLYKKSP
jgi:hypothetical protein